MVNNVTQSLVLVTVLILCLFDRFYQLFEIMVISNESPEFPLWKTVEEKAESLGDVHG